jgi:hypothetical protein
MGMNADKITATAIGISIGVIAFFAVIAVARFIFGGPEDTWICTNGQWVMHGKPFTPKPTAPCL